MIVSNTKNFIFVHVPKTGGTSIKTVLQRHGTMSVYKEYKYRGVVQENKNLWKHSKSQTIKNNIPRDLWNSCFKFAFVRNPWDWLVSVYFYIKKDKADNRHKLCNSMDFKGFVRWFILDSPDIYPIKSGQISFVSNRKGKIILDFVGRFEKLEKHTRYIFKKIGVRRSIPHRNKTEHKKYREYYDKYTKNLVGDFFEKDIVMFNYEF